MVGLNSRDLRSLEVDPERLLRLADQFPAGWPRVAESGIGTPRTRRPWRRPGMTPAWLARR